MNIEDTVGRCPTDQTQDLARQALDAMPDHEAIQVILAWAKDAGMLDELQAHLEDAIPTDDS